MVEDEEEEAGGGADPAGNGQREGDLGGQLKYAGARACVCVRVWGQAVN